uniref:Phosphatidate cytidylyltransferase, mitochondrial n=1 Tax=Steinernema glaseri TaxID=37863 RepID=A0A1I7YHU0_9BILA
MKLSQNKGNCLLDTLNETRRLAIDRFSKGAKEEDRRLEVVKLDSPRGSKRRADMEHVTAQLRDFWPNQQKKIDDLDYPTLREINKHQELPLARIKKIMRIDEDVRAHMISSEVPVLLAKAAEVFIEELTLRAWYHTEESKRKTIQRSDISTACSRCDMFDFLIDIVPREDVMKTTRPPMVGTSSYMLLLCPKDRNAISVRKFLSPPLQETVTYVEPETHVQHVTPQPSQDNIVYLSCPPTGYAGEQVLQIDNGHGQILQATQIGPSIPLSTAAGAQGHTIQIMGDQHNESLRELIEGLPLDTVEFCFAYGSGAVAQKSEDMSEKMVDFVIATNDPVRFHTDNVSRNPGHYSWLRYIGGPRVARFQQYGGAHVIYNTNVTVNTRKIKYGVVSVGDLKADLLDWRWFYLAGRLQKPVVHVIGPNPKVLEELKENRISALQVALLLLPESFTMEELLNQIVALSYNGDFRMLFGEDKNKVSKIVQGALDRLSAVYSPLLEADSRVAVRGMRVEQDSSTAAYYHRLNLLPSTVLNRLQTRSRFRDAHYKDIEEVLFSLAHRSDVDRIVASAVSSIVAPSALAQTAKNAVSAGIVKSAVYSGAKLLKMFKSVRV